jgi:hypothetical protein
MQKTNVLQILIVALTSVLALTNFDKSDFGKEKVKLERIQTVNHCESNIMVFKTL